MSDRKYRQHGYQDSSPEKPQAGRPQPKSKDMTFGPRPVNMAPMRTVSRCAQCGAVLQILGELPETCAKCGLPLHSCKQCANFEPASHFECRAAITARIPRKDERNQCSLYVLRTSVERETSSAASRGNDARKAFDALFKK